MAARAGVRVASRMDSAGCRSGQTPSKKGPGKPARGPSCRCRTSCTTESTERRRSDAVTRTAARFAGHLDSTDCRRAILKAVAAKARACAVAFWPGSGRRCPKQTGLDQGPGVRRASSLSHGSSTGRHWPGGSDEQGKNPSEKVPHEDSACLQKSQQHGRRAKDCEPGRLQVRRASGRRKVRLSPRRRLRSSKGGKGRSPNGRKATRRSSPKNGRTTRPVRGGGAVLWPSGQREASNTSGTEPAWSLRSRRSQTPVGARGGRGTKPAGSLRSRRSQTPVGARGGRGTLAAKKTRARAQQGGALAGRRGSSGGRCVPDMRAAEWAAYKVSPECLGAQSDWERSLADRAQRTEHRMGRYRVAPRVGPGHDPRVWMKYLWKSPKLRPAQGRRKRDTRERDPRGQRTTPATEIAHCDFALQKNSTGRTEGKGRISASQRGIQPALAPAAIWPDVGRSCPL